MVEIYYDDEMMNTIISHLGEVNHAVQDKANERGRVAKGRLASHHDTGAAEVTVTHGDVDSFINLDDTAGEGAAMSIEFGHWVKGKFEDPDHPQFVPGLYIITGAAGLDSTPKQGPRRSKS